MPGLLFLACAALTAIALAIDVFIHRRRARLLRKLAAEWQMHYHPGDQLRLTSKVLPHLPIIGAANVRLMDLLYGSQRKHHRYVFSVEYTIGVIGLKRRVVRVASLIEPRGREEVGPLSVTLAPVEGNLLEQYRALAVPHETTAGNETS
jgi:hypothetical protein